ncbi:MAG: M3 family oligoendopeptidase [Hyphomicrobiales bacterium]|uniref:M3 family oligoendopeptidase n=1 Tax=Rhabdaerophilum calidifontis TaxID=2604328 RepID=UPI001238DA6C|nr:M3 family oligoendopeptidase [Rhabdaerophilum calidifontis]MCA1953056.1 M3 family oligoendopeptidase [Hyphomicrobiales bacterium]
MRPNPALLPAASGAESETALGDLPEWRLDDLYPGMDSLEFAADFAAMSDDARAFAARYRGKLAALAAGAEGGAALFEAIRAYEAIEERMGRIISYAGLIYSTDTTNPIHGKFYGDTQEKVTEAGSELLFFTLELNLIDDQLMDRLMAAAPLDHYRPWLVDLRRDKPFQLEDRIEQLFHEKSVTGRAAWNRLFDETMASLRFDIAGETLTLEPTLARLQDADENRRRAAGEALAKTLAENTRLFTLITNTLAKDKEISDRWRGFRDVAESRHLANRVEPEVVDAMVQAIEAAHPRLSHRYYALKARWFGKERLEFWDRNAPLPKVPQRTIPWEEARETVLSAYAGFSPQMAEIARRFFDGRWIDAPTRPGKAPGAFAHPTVPSAHPYVLVNYLGKPRDVMTLAHELGHGVHQVLAAPNGALMAPTPLTLAETASVFGEMLTFRRILAGTQEVAQRKALLAGKVEDMINTVVRQVAFYAFERRVHSERRNGELTTERLNEIWIEVQSKSLGPAIHLGPGYEVFWAYIPHFIHSPFYVYAYAFGDCLVNSLYGVYQKADPKFVENYFALLAAGGTRHHSELLAPFGLDARDPAFWQIGLSVIDGMITELEGMEG